jgi:hypothetical protein
VIKRIIAACVIALGSITLTGSVASADTSNVCKIRMVEWGVNAPGTDKPSNANYEFKRLYNPGPTEVDVEGWWVQDAYPHVYKLQANKVGAPLAADSPFRKSVDADGTGPGTAMEDHFVMPAGSNVYVYNGTGTDGNPTNLTAALYSGLGHHHNNAGDTLSLRDKDDTVVDWATYTPYRTRHAC